MTIRPARPMTFDQLKGSWRWRPMPNCPGRFVFSDGETDLTPAQILGDEAIVTEHTTDRAKDSVLVAAIDGGGLISYRKASGYLHTLNTAEGFERKLAQLGITIVSPR